MQIALEYFVHFWTEHGSAKQFTIGTPGGHAETNMIISSNFVQQAIIEFQKTNYVSQRQETKLARIGWIGKLLENLVIPLLESVKELRDTLLYLQLPGALGVVGCGTTTVDAVTLITGILL